MALLNSRRVLRGCGITLGVWGLLWAGTPGAASERAGVGASGEAAAGYEKQVRPLIAKYCVGCHNAEKHKGGLDLERFATVAQVRKEVKPWQAMIEIIEAGEMPPKDKPQPSGAEAKQITAWVHEFLDSEARARAGDPGHVPVRRLSNAEYDYTIRDLTGVDLRPAREFPADGAAGEGFTNAAEALSDISPTLFNKYLLSAKEVAAHAVLTPDGFRFSMGKTRRDWSDESLAKLRAFYAQFTADGKVALGPYIGATIRYREKLKSGAMMIEQVAATEKLNAKYLGALWGVLNEAQKSAPLEGFRRRWLATGEREADALAKDLEGFRGEVWKVVPIGSYRDGNLSRQSANNAMIAETQTIRLSPAPRTTQGDVVVFLKASDVLGNAQGGHVVWSRARFEAEKKPTLMLCDYAKFGAGYEVDFAALFADSAKYLDAVAAIAIDGKLKVAEVATKEGLDAARLSRWNELLAVGPKGDGAAEGQPAMRTVPVINLELLGEKILKSDQRAAINGWRSKGNELPVLLSNSSDKEEHIPGRASGHKVVVHPMPKEFVAVTWTSPADAKVRVTGNVAHAHPNCGNGVAWWLELRHGGTAGVLAEGAVELGKQAEIAARTFSVAKGDVMMLAIDAKNQDHSCDLTEIDWKISEVDGNGRIWDLAANVADTVLEGNPHADKLGNRDVWRFVKGASRALGNGGGEAGAIANHPTLARWHEAAGDASRQKEASALALELQAVLSGGRPAKEKEADRKLYDAVVSMEGPLLRGIDATGWPRKTPAGVAFGLDAKRFGVDEAGKAFDGQSFVAGINSVTEIHLPALLMQERQFVVEGRLAGDARDRAVRLEVSTVKPGTDSGWDGRGAVVVKMGGAAQQELVRGLDAFRAVFPLFTCYPGVIPLDEVVCLKMYHREDEPLIRLFLNEEQRAAIERLWAEHRFITQQPIAENKYLPQFIGFVTQDQTKEMLAYYEAQREPFRKRAEAFEAELVAAEGGQIEKLVEFASRAFRRPLVEGERGDLIGLYQSLRKNGVSHDEAFRGVLARVLVAPSFLFKLERAPEGKEAGAVNDWELATRLSYFLWASPPDEELRSLAGAGKLREPRTLEAQAMRMLKDERVRALGIEFGTQWIHVRGFDSFAEKSERLFPTFDAKLRQAIYEESVLFFKDLFQQDRAVTNVLDADYTYLNEPLAKHYGIPGVKGTAFVRVDSVRKFGRGGILGLASVQAKQAGASRTSPVLRGNWVVETLLGEKLPRPPADVPRLPEEEGGAQGLTTRQLVEKHTRVESCMVCHQRIDPLGFSFEAYDAIGRLRAKESTGLPIDCHAVLKDGTQFEGLDGLRNYLLTKKKDVIVRLFCRKLLGYALGRAVTLSDQPLVEQMMAALERNDGRLSAAVLEIVRSAQFHNIRGAAYAEEE